ncbi:MAG TPA: hypothetical protein DEA96_04055 [Leptospiraceae bacterium]|nr:hypothetical protein [Spirochaetaceae bacterium]HBS04115.1 hypothetical protein [Leptospiraceae bacterium]|tara:strand:+ start:306210 stop:306722 length:513 start_codon:yes stop_codon:yes gene_type:complete
MPLRSGAWTASGVRFLSQILWIKHFTPYSVAAGWAGMFHRDYILRLIQEFAVFLARLTGLKDRNDPEVVFLELERSFRQFLGYDSPLLESLGPDGALSVLSAADGGNPDQLAMGAILFREKAENYRKYGDPGMAAKCEKLSARLSQAIDGRPLSPEIRKLLESTPSAEHS